MIKIINKYRFLQLSLFFLIILLLYIRLLFIFSYSIDNDGLEYYFVHIIQEILSGQPMYRNPQDFPYSINLYTPVYFYLLSILVRLSKLNIYNDLHQILVLGRMLSFFIILLQLFYLAKLMRKFTASNFIIVVSITLYLLLISGHIYAVRPDALKILFFIVFVYYLLEYLFFSHQLKHAMLCIGAAVLGVYTKQDIAVHITLYFFVAFILLRSKKIILLFAIFIAGCLLGWFGIWLLYGKYIFYNLILFNLQSVKDILLSFNMIFIVFSIFRTFPLFIVVFLNLRKINSFGKELNAARFIVLISSILIPLTYLSLMRPGANLNYTYELSIFLVLNLGLYISFNLEKINQYKKIFYGLLVSYVIFLILTNALIKNYDFDRSKEALNIKEYQRCLSERGAIKQIIQNDTCFFPDTKYSIFYLEKPVVLGHDMHLDRFIKLYTNLDSIFYGLDIKTKLLYIDTKEYDDNFKNGRIKYIIIEHTSELMQHVAYFYPAYQPYKEVGNMLIYTFQNAPK